MHWDEALVRGSYPVEQIPNRPYICGNKYNFFSEPDGLIQVSGLRLAVRFGLHKVGMDMVSSGLLAAASVHTSKRAISCAAEYGQEELIIM